MKSRSIAVCTPAAVLAVLALANAAGTARAAGLSTGGKPAPTRPSIIAQIFEDASGPKARLLDGREYPLMALPEALKQRIEADAAASAALGAEADAATPGDFGALVDPPYVDNRAYHGPIRDQGGRNTCVSFSTTAAVEGRYRRLNPVTYAGLDLSEQWANHLQKMVSLPEDLMGSAALRESQMGCWGGSNNQYLMRVLKKYGLPTEATMAYNSSGSYENTTEVTDSPKVDWTDPTVTQRTVDNFNLDPYTLPLTALETALYRPVGVTNLTYAQVRDPSFLEGLVRGGYDVVFDIGLVTPQVTTADGAWKPGASPSLRGAHSMLIVGYNRTKQYFIVRNSWGYDGTDGGYVRISYDYLQGFAYSGCYVTSVVDPALESAQARRYVGRWQMNHDGWPGTLDIYRLPGLYASGELKGQTDYRLGTYFDHAGKAHRVNGFLWGGDLVFYINFSSPNAPYGSLTGTFFKAQVFSWDDENLAGLEVQDGVTYGFHATKQSTPAHIPAPYSANTRDAFLGHWKMNHDGWKGDLYLSAAAGWYQDGLGNWHTTDASTGVSGSYKDGDGNWHSVVGAAFGRELKYYIWFGSWQPFDVYLYSWDKGLMSGVCWWGSDDFGITACRVGS